jgi:outer membrane protein assembly factor BamD
MNRCLSALLISLCLLALAGCSSTGSENEPKEVVKASLTVSTTDQLRLLKEAQEAFEKELFTLARDAFEKLKNSYPLGPYAEFADIKIADSYFAQGQYSSAATRFESFIKEHPASASFEYALMKAGRSFQLSNKGVGRDPSSLLRALEYYSKLIDQYPQGTYYQEAVRFKAETRVSLAEHERSVLQYYRKNGYDAAYEKRSAEFKAKWSDLVRQGLVQALD